MSRYKKDDSGGFGNPPVSGQFRKGCKPGPGRPKGSRTMEGALRSVYGGNVPYLENGEPKKAPATIALAKRSLQHGLSGSARANAIALELAAKYGPAVDPDPTTRYNLDAFSKEELDEFSRLTHKALGLDPPEPPPPRDFGLPWFDRTIDGIEWEHSRVPNVPRKLISVGSRAYVSTCLPRHPFRPDGPQTAAEDGNNDADL